MTRAREGSSLVSEPRSTARACQFCRKRKIKCDALKPTCTTCRASNRTCSYHHGPVKPRPSTALLNAAREEKNELERMLIRLKLAPTVAERDALLGLVDVINGKVHIRAGAASASSTKTGAGATNSSQDTSAAAAAAALASMPTSEAAGNSSSLSPSHMAIDSDMPRNGGYPTPSGSRTRETASEEGEAAVSEQTEKKNGHEDEHDASHVTNNEDDDDDEEDDEDDDDEDEEEAKDTTVQDDNTIALHPFEKRTYMGVLVPPAGPSMAMEPTNGSSHIHHSHHHPTPHGVTPSIDAQSTLRYQLIANAAMSRQQEYRLRLLPTIRGVPAELALHLLDLHWNRQHHTYLLTYRPAFMRELVDGGEYCTDFLLYAVFACASKFSERIELRTDPGDPETTGKDFFRRCEDIIARDAVLSQSRIPTIVGLLMLGATYNARGFTSKGWLYTGYALRMVFDLGLHIEEKENSSGLNPEQIEIRRRVFWGAFICEKLQSVYLGRPATIQLRDADVSRDFLDTFEELEPWAPYVDPMSQADATSMAAAGGRWNNAVTHSVSVFQQLCSLAKIMTNIINKIYFATNTAATAAGGAAATVATTPTGTATAAAPKSRKKMSRALRQIDNALVRWYRELPPHLVYEPWATRGTNVTTPTTTATPNLTILHTTYHCLVILLHCPFISAGTQVATNTAGVTSSSAHGEEATHAWKRCTTAARNITNLALAYRATYPLRKSNYMLVYAVYVACTIHVHNAAAVFGAAHSNNADNTVASDPSLLLRASLVCLDELAVPNSGAADTARIIRKLMAAKGIPEHLGPSFMSGGANTAATNGNVVDAAAHFFSQDMATNGTATNPNTNLNGDTIHGPAPATSFDDTNFTWQLFDESPSFDPLAQLQSFSDFGLSGHDLLFGFMDGNFSPSEFMGAS
ncbi:hypothetical protein Sste5346_000148 [Sporothrix stenoceras]|uniref:Zn(2)-C6 fungal-type domain-containing protein n=1 Tax=Sporothrix stenoceras TaxID=5173 RepID=A0ABR3ZS64_9PEZI